VPNLSADHNRFLLDPEAHIRVRRDARNRGLAVVGYYHSHPRSPAEPSARDVAEAADPAAVHVIVSLEADAPSLRAFTIAGGGFVELPVVDGAGPGPAGQSP
jgi:proteasome lid subunit RPN8/RPN11